MLVKDYFPKLKKNYSKMKFKGIAFNSKLVKKDFIFFAIKGNKIDGNKFINEAIKKGAKIVVSQKIIEKSNKKILYIYDKNPRKLLAEVSSKLNNKKPNNLIAVTGTNGKSSIANFYYQILKLNKIKSASIGTLGVHGINYKKKISNTTFDPLALNKLLNLLKIKKINNVILEASSHGLKQNRLDGLKFNTGIFTNLSRDHLDYHKTFKDYLDSKLILFNKLMKKNSNIIYDNHIKESRKLKKISTLRKLKSLNIGYKNSDLKIVSHKFVNYEQKIKFLMNNKIYSFSTKLIGKIQIKNVLMATLAAYKSNLSLKKIIKSLQKLKPVTGRLEKIGHLKNNSLVILDYAHSPAALDICLKNISEQFKFRKINLVFGCGGERDKPKRKIMGKIANKYCNKIYLTDDNPRSENPKKIREDIKVNILKSKLLEVPSRDVAIKKAIFNIKSDEIVVVAGRGHELYQEYKKTKYFSDRESIIKAIKKKNNSLNDCWKTNIVEEILGKKLINNIKINNSSINSREIKKNNIFFGIKGKKIDGNRFADNAIKKGASLSIIDKKYGENNDKKIKVKNSLKFFSKCSNFIRISSGISSIAITGSSGKTSLKELLGRSLNKISPTTYSAKSYNNKYGVPISLFNVKKNDKFGVFEVGMNKGGEIDYLTKIIKPDVGVITNISYAHIKNFKNLNGIAKAKSEIIDNIIENGTLVINSDDSFYEYFKKKALKNKLKIISFGKKNKANIMLTKIKKINRNSYIFINSNGKKIKFLINENLEIYKDNLLACLAVISNYFDLESLNENFFNNYILPEGRGDQSIIKIKKKKLNLIDESYNSNPSSLKFAIDKFSILNSKSKKKIVLLGDMFELGKYSKKLHFEAAKTLNKADIDKVYVYGKKIIYTFNKIRPQKRGKVLNSKKDILNFLINDIKNGEYLMIKGSNSTGLNSITQNLKLGMLSAL